MAIFMILILIYNFNNQYIYIFITQKIRMSNIHGLNNQPNNRPNQRRAQLNQNNQHQNDQNISMLGMTETDLRLMGNEIANNRIPFVNIMSESISPLD